MVETRVPLLSLTPYASLFVASGDDEREVEGSQFFFQRHPSSGFAEEQAYRVGQALLAFDIRIKGSKGADRSSLVVLKNCYTNSNS